MGRSRRLGEHQGRGCEEICIEKVITRFKVPQVLISDNELQFDSKAFQEYCSNLGITNRYSSPAYPKSNGQVEATNKTIVNSLKKRLEGAKGN